MLILLHNSSGMSRIHRTSVVNNTRKQEFQVSCVSISERVNISQLKVNV